MFSIRHSGLPGVVASFPSSSISGRTIEALHRAIAELEASGASQDDPGFVTLKNILLQRIADLELAKANGEARSEPTISENPSPAAEKASARGLSK